MKNIKFLLIIFLLVFEFKVFAGQEVSKVVALVNGEVITSQDLEEYCQMVKYTSHETDKRPIEDMSFRKDSLNKLIEDRLILVKAKAEKVDIPDGEIDKRIDSIRASFPSPEAFEKFMSDKSLNMKNLRDKVTEQIIVTETIDKYVKAFISNSPQEISKYYQDHQSQLIVKPQYTLLVAQGVDIPKLEEIASAIKANGAEASLQRYSSVLVKAETDLEELKEELAAMAKQSKEGESVIKTFDGKNYLIFVEKIIPSRQKDFTEANKEIDDLLWKQKYEEKLNLWLKELKERAVIVVYPPYGEVKTAVGFLTQPAGSNETLVLPVNNTSLGSFEPAQLPANNTTIAAVEIPANLAAVNNQTIAAAKNDTAISFPQEPVLQVNNTLNQTVVNQTASN